jgi:V8-like Glu-specific endopeptidase
MARRKLLVLAAGVLLVGALAPMRGALAGPSIAEDPCRDRPATELDRRTDWRCVGLATYADPSAEPREPELTEEEARRHDVIRPASWELGVAVSPDGRLYRQVSLSPTGLQDVRGNNPNPPDVEPEGEPRPESPRGSSGGIGIESVWGADNRVLRLSTTSYPWRAMGAILPPGSNTSNCSGSLIGPRHLLTAGHCIHQGGGGPDAGWFPNRKVAPGQSGIGNFPNGLKNHAWYFSVVGWFDWADPAYDYAMIVLQDLDSTAHLGWLGWRSSDHDGEFWTFGYPAWWQTCAASPSANGLCNNYLYGDDNTASPILSKQIGHKADTQGGQSGSPMYKYNGGDRRVIAVHAYAGNWGTRVTSARSNNFCDWIHSFPSAFNNHPCE